MGHHNIEWYLCDLMSLEKNFLGLALGPVWLSGSVKLDFQGLTLFWGLFIGTPGKTDFVVVVDCLMVVDGLMVVDCLMDGCWLEGWRIELILVFSYTCNTLF